MLRPFFPELVISTDLLSFEHPSVLLFCLDHNILLIQGMDIRQNFQGAKWARRFEILVVRTKTYGAVTFTFYKVQSTWNMFIRWKIKVINSFIFQFKFIDTVKHSLLLTIHKHFLTHSHSQFLPHNHSKTLPLSQSQNLPLFHLQALPSLIHRLPLSQSLTLPSLIYWLCPSLIHMFYPSLIYRFCPPLSFADYVLFHSQTLPLSHSKTLSLSHSQTTSILIRRLGPSQSQMHSFLSLCYYFLILIFWVFFIVHEYCVSLLANLCCETLVTILV